MQEVEAKVQEGLYTRRRGGFYSIYMYKDFSVLVWMKFLSVIIYMYNVHVYMLIKDQRFLQSEKD